jgi:hypothetical protein
MNKVVHSFVLMEITINSLATTVFMWQFKRELIGNKKLVKGGFSETIIF